MVTAANGEVIYDGASEPASEAAATSKEIPFGKFNTQFTSDTKSFTVGYKINSDVEAKLDEDALAGLSVSIVSRVVEAERPTPAVSEYTVDVASVGRPEELVAAASTATAVPAPVDNATPVPTDGPVEINSIKKVCGKDITPGRYLVTGNGIVRIEGADGTLKHEDTVKEGENGGKDSVEAFVATIVEGDVITAAPLPGQDKPSVKFEKTNSASDANASKNADSKKEAAAASTAKPAAAKTTAARATAAPANAKAAAKANPKTGEDSAEIAWLCTLMAAMAAGVVALEIIKRKKLN